MSKFPVEVSDDEGVIDAVNYLLSGPQGLGQNFSGFNSYINGYLTGNYRIPFTQPNPALIYVSAIALGVSEIIDPRTFKHYFASAQPSPPFALGQPVDVQGVTNDFYDGTYSPIGVVECTTTYFIARTTGSYDVTTAPSSGGTAQLSLNNFLTSTDANARVTTTSATDRVFISAQLNNALTYTSTVTGSLIYKVQVNRYLAEPNNDPTNPDFVFTLDSTISEKKYVLPVAPTVDGVSTFTFAGDKANSQTNQPQTFEISPVTTTGSGSGLRVSLTLQPTTNSSSPYTVPYDGSNTTITIINPGTGYAIGDTVTIPAYELGPYVYDTDADIYGPFVPDNDIVLTITATLAAGTISTATLPEIETIFTTVIDNPRPAYYWYILEVKFDNWLNPDSGDVLAVYRSELNLRSLSAQVVKE
ncbi:MAG: hypothetical protein AC479_06860 [miscellaneous Crenarchaeota group-6 archaeon AD8-1]|nr:MAG: hypothetical protein AC479_06860 [miscellaneous Crenarchaeota group-6 archaeon AD8-1]